MSDQDHQAPTDDTVTDTPEQHNDEPTVDYQARYTEAQAWGTRASQEAAEYRRQLDALKNGDREAFAALGLELADYDEQEEDDEPQPGESQAAFEKRIAALEERYEQQVHEQRLNTTIAHVERELDDIGGLGPEHRNTVAAHALSMDPLDNGMPNIKGAYEALTKFATSSRPVRPSAPHVANGQAGNKSLAFSEMSREQRAEYMAQRNDSLTE